MLKLYSVNVLREECWSIVLSALSGAQTESAREAALHVFGALADAARPAAAHSAHQALLDAALAVCADHTKHATPTVTTALDCLGNLLTVLPPEECMCYLFNVSVLKFWC